MRRYADEWVVWVRATARAAALWARHVYDRLVGKLEEAGVRLNLTSRGGGDGGHHHVGQVDSGADAWAREWGRPRARWRGPLAAVQAAIRRVRWVARGPLDWADAGGEQIPVDDQAALKEMIHADFRRREWAVVAARRPDFRGAEGGVDEAVTGAPSRRLVKRGRDRQVGRLRCVSQARLAAAGLAESAVCPCAAPRLPKLPGPRA